MVGKIQREHRSHRIPLIVIQQEVPRGRELQQAAGDGTDALPDLIRVRDAPLRGVFKKTWRPHRDLGRR